MQRRAQRSMTLFAAAIMTAALAAPVLIAMRTDTYPGWNASPEFWTFAAFAVVGELLPIRLPHRAEPDEFATSTTFTFAVLLTWGTMPAVAVQALASLVADFVARGRPSEATGRRWSRPLENDVSAYASPGWESAFKVFRYAVAVVAGGLLLSAVGIPHVDERPALTAGDLPAFLAAAAVFFLVNHALSAIAMALARGVPAPKYLLRDLAFHATTASVLLALSPIAVVVGDRNLAFIPLLLVPMAVVYVWRRQAVLTEYQALYDGLTGLPNRALFGDLVRQAILAAQRAGTKVAVMIIDVDRFKEINDTLGHRQGDLLLREIGPRLVRTLRCGDTVARLGGDEFGVLLPDVPDGAAAVNVVEKAISGLARPFTVADMVLFVDASFGIAIAPEHGRDADTLLQRADVAMYQAKEAHTGYEMYEPERDGFSPVRLGMAAELRVAIQVGALELFYQPKADLRSGRITGVEALSRWRHERLGNVSPDEFIPIAERIGLIRPLTSRALKRAVRQCHEWRQTGVDLSVAVNLSARSLLDPALPDRVSRLLEHWKVPADRLVLEITESGIMADPARAEEILSGLRRMGVALAIDDFGTGYSSLAQLKRLPVDEIKIDKSFVMGMVTDEDDAAIVRSTIDLARNLGLRVVAEGVESEEIWARLANLGCDVAQGYYLSPPVPAEDVLRKLGGAPMGSDFAGRTPRPDPARSQQHPPAGPRAAAPMST